MSTNDATFSIIDVMISISLLSFFCSIAPKKPMRFCVKKSHGLRYVQISAPFARFKMQNFCIFLNLTVLLPERFTDVLPSAYTFGTLFGILQRAIQIQSRSFWEPLRVLLLRWANCRFPAPFFWHNMQLTNFIIALFFLLSILL